MDVENPSVKTPPADDAEIRLTTLMLRLGSWTMWFYGRGAWPRIYKLQAANSRCVLESYNVATNRTTSKAGVRNDFFSSIKTYCLPILLYGCETWRMSSSDKHKLDVAWNNCFRKIFNACWRESAKPLLFYCGTMLVSLLVDQRKMIFYNKTLRSSNIVLRVVCRLHLYEAQRLFSVCHVFSRAYRQRRY